MSAPAKGPFTIVGLEVENYKRIRAVHIDPKGNVIELSGKNRQGKTSILDAIWSVFKQASVTNDRPIHDGADRATIKVNLGTIRAERRYSEKGTTLVLESAEGAKFSKPQQLLDEIIGDLSFDPLAFTRMKPAEQYDQLRRMVPLEVDVDQLEAMNEGDFGRRTELNRAMSAKRATASALIVPDGLPDQPLDEKALLDKIEGAARANADIEKRKMSRARVADEVRNLSAAAQAQRDRAADFRRLAEEAERTATMHEQEAMVQKRRLETAEPLPAPVDVAATRQELERAQQINAGIAKARERERIRAEADELARQAEELTQAMQGRNHAVIQAIANAKMPIAGLSFAKGQVTFNGQPFSQASGAEQLMVSMAIGMFANPKLRVILIRDASLLDDESMVTVRKMAEKHGYQVWLERVTSNQGVGVYIEDGTVVAVDGRKVAGA